MSAVHSLIASADALLPCPFCGNETVEVGAHPSFYVSCYDCGTEGPWFDGESNRGDMPDGEARQKATDAWNTRAPIIGGDA